MSEANYNASTRLINRLNRLLPLPAADTTPQADRYDPG